ncbi:MAG: ABC transporter permease, partial [Terriglobales bacterium]
MISEPDVLAGNLSLGPRLLLTQGGLRRTGIIQFGSQVRSRLVFQLGPGAPGLEAVEAELRKAFPHSYLTDYRHANPAVERGLEHATTFLSLISLMALVVGALGVASAMDAHLQLRLDSIATMKVLGARQSQILRIYGLQTLALGLAGGGLGVAFSLGVARAFPWLLSPFFPDLPALRLHAVPLLEGLAAGVLITLLFSLPTLAGLRRVRPAWILRRHMSDDEPGRVAHGLERAGWALGLGAGVALLATTLTDEPWRTALRFSGYFLLALAVAVALLALVCWLLLRGLRTLLWAWRRPPLALRHGLANLYRPGSQARTVMLVLGLGVMFTLSVFLLQRGLLGDLRLAMPPGVANVFLFDIPPQQVSALQRMLAEEPGRAGTAEILGTIQAHLPGQRREVTLASFGGQPAGIAVTAGQWWSSSLDAAPEV